MFTQRDMNAAVYTAMSAADHLNEQSEAALDAAVNMALDVEPETWNDQMRSIFSGLNVDVIHVPNHKMWFVNSYGRTTSYGFKVRGARRAELFATQRAAIRRAQVVANVLSNTEPGDWRYRNPPARIAFAG
jgi:hypothetical protein